MWARAASGTRKKRAVPGSSSHLSKPWWVLVVALAEDVVSDGLTAANESVPGSGCSEYLCALGVGREDRYAAKSTRIEELLFVRNGGREIVVGVLGEGKRVGDRVVAEHRLRNFHLDLRLEICTSCDNPLTQSCSKGGCGCGRDGTDRSS